MRRLRAAALTVAAVGLLVVARPAAAITPAKSTPVSTTVTTPSGLSLRVTPARRLNPTSALIKVSGRGFDPTVGIYVALCVTPARGQQPTPCGGGIPTFGASTTVSADVPAGSFWISSNPPPTAANLVVPFKPGGRFSVTLKVGAVIGTAATGEIDCRRVSCSVVTRADHTRTSDRSFDVVVPVRFKAS